jgi:SET domain-containing protein
VQRAGRSSLKWRLRGLPFRDSTAWKRPMLMVKTYLDRSPIHGLGVFASEFIRKETKIWRFVEGFDRCYTPKQFARLPKQAREYLKSYAYRVDGEILFTADNDHYINHSDDPNTYLKNGYVLARRNIRKGEEITNDYREFDPALCAGFLKRK